MGTFCKFTQKNWIYALWSAKNVFRRSRHHSHNLVFNKKGGYENHSRPKTKHEKKLSVYDFHATVDELGECLAF